MLVGEMSNFFHVVTRTAAEKTVMFYVILITRENIERHSVHEKRNAHTVRLLTKNIRCVRSSQVTIHYTVRLEHVHVADEG